MNAQRQFQLTQLTSRLTPDPELLKLDSGSVQSTRQTIENTGRNETGQVDASTSRNASEATARVLCTDRLVAIDGRLDYPDWAADDGVSRSVIGGIGNIELLAPARAARPTVEPAAA